MTLRKYFRSRLGASFMLMLVLATISFAPNASSQSTDGLEGYWSFDGDVGVAIDRSGNGRNGTWIGNPLPVPAWSGTGMAFNGTNSSLDFGSLVSVNTFTVSAYVLLAPEMMASPPESASIIDHGRNYGLLVRRVDGVLRFEASYGGWAGVSVDMPPARSVTALVANRFYHVSMTYRDGVSLRLYVDSVLEGQTPHSPGVCCSAGIGSPVLSLGSRGGIAGFFKGVLDEVRVYRRELTETEIAQLAVAPTPPRFVQMPTSKSVVVDAQTTLSAVAEGTRPLTYQWLKGNVPISDSTTITGANTASLVLSKAGASDTGPYSIVVSNFGGSVTSVVAVLTVDDGDKDEDGLPDSWEAAFGLNPNSPLDATYYPPGDRLTYLQKYLVGLNPLNPQNDSDGVSDFEELFEYGTDPFRTDTDGDGMSDQWELAHGLNPRVNDAAEDFDRDGITNQQEFGGNSDPRLVHSFPDGVSDYERANGGERPNRFFYDRNDRLVGAEYDTGLAIAYFYDGNDNPTRQVQLLRGSDTNGIPALWSMLNGLTNRTVSHSAFGDADGDGWSNWQEWKMGTSPGRASGNAGNQENSGKILASLTVPFVPDGFLIATGQIGASRSNAIVVGADGDPGSSTNLLFVLNQTASSWTSDRVDVGSFGITSLAVGRVANRPSAGIYLGLRGPTNGSGQVMEFIHDGSTWRSSLVIRSADRAAFVLGLRNGEILVRISGTEAGERGVFGVKFQSGSWGSPSLLTTNVSTRGLGTVLSTEGYRYGLQLLNSGGIEMLNGGNVPTNAVYRPGTRKLYFPIGDTMTWSESQAYARQFGGNLVTILDEAENAFVSDLLPKGAGAWIGLYRNSGSNPYDPKSWMWASGYESSYRKWQSGEPNDSGGPDAELWVQMEGSGNPGWRDLGQAPTQMGIGELLLQERILEEPPATQYLNWRGSSLAATSLRSTSIHSLFYPFVDDKNSNNRVDSGDEFVFSEYQLIGANVTLHSASRMRINSRFTAQSYGITPLTLPDGTNQVIVTGEPDGQVFAWSLTNGSSALERRLFSSAHLGKAWHAMAAVRTIDPQDGLVGLRVAPENPTICDVVLWTLPTELPRIASLPNTPPAAIVLPHDAVLGNLASLTVRLWDAEGNVATPELQFQMLGLSDWRDAKIEAPSGSLFTIPGGTNHKILWNALGDLGPGVNRDVLLRARATDMVMVGEWSVGIPFHVDTTMNPDADRDGLPDEWEMRFFGLLSQVGTDDPDGDGYSNLAEYRAGTHPTTASSNFALKVRLEGDQLLLEWSGDPVVPFYLERRDNLVPAEEWAVERINPTKGLLLPTALQETYFRLRLEN